MIIRRDSVLAHTRSSPEWGTVTHMAMGDAGGLTQFGVTLQILAPGARSSVRHWHPYVDEFLWVVSGEVTVTEDDGEHTLGPGDAACWPAGVRNGHTVSNRADQPCTYLIVGSRSADMSAVYVEPPGAEPPSPASA